MDLFRAEQDNNNLKGVSFKTGFWMTIGLAILGFVASGMLLTLLLKGDVQAMKDPANANLMRIVQTIGVIISMFLPAWIAASYLSKKPVELLGFQKHVSISQVLLTLTIIFLAMFTASAFGELNRAIPIPAGMAERFEKLETEYAEQVKIMGGFKGIGGYILGLIMLALIPAICEETLFRGGLQNFLTRSTKTPWLSIVIVSILFSLIHSSFYGFLPRFFLGVVLGMIYHLSRNLWLPILAHFFNNALAVTAMYTFTSKGKDIQEAMKEGGEIGYWGLLGLPLLFILFRSLYRSSENKISM